MGRFTRRTAAGTALLAAALSVGLPAQAEADSQLVVRIEGVRSDGGFVRLGVFDRADAFPRGRPIAGRTVPAAAGSVTAVIEGLPDGRYAIAVYHDEDGDGQFTKNFIGLPLEGYGFSNDAPVVLGPPEFDTAAIEVSGGVAETEIRTRY
jgi:uncharacterized protein (DUF2141 family)